MQGEYHKIEANHKVLGLYLWEDGSLDVNIVGEFEDYQINIDLDREKAKSLASILSKLIDNE